MGQRKCRAGGRLGPEGKVVVEDERWTAKGCNWSSRRPEIYTPSTIISVPSNNRAGRPMLRTDQVSGLPVLLRNRSAGV